MQEPATVTIIGRDASGKIVAEEKTDRPGKAKQVADGWKASGLEVEVKAAGAETPTK